MYLLDPISTSSGPKRPGTTTLAWPLYRIVDPTAALDTVCSFLEQMTPGAFEAWFSLPDSFLGMSCSGAEMDFADMYTRGFLILADFIRRVRRLRLRLQISFHPHTPVRWTGSY